MGKINLSSIGGVKGAPVAREARVAVFKSNVQRLKIAREPLPGMKLKVAKWTFDVPGGKLTVNVIGLTALGFAAAACGTAGFHEISRLGTNTTFLDAASLGFKELGLYVALLGNLGYLAKRAAAHCIEYLGAVRSFRELEPGDHQGMVEYASQESPKLAKTLELQMRRLAEAQEEALEPLVLPPVTAPVQGAAESVKPADARIKELELLVAEKEQMVRQGSDKTAQLEAGLHEMTAQVAKMNKEIIGLMNEKEGMAAQVKDLTGQVSRLTEAMKAMQATLESKMKAMEGRMAVEIANRDETITTLEAVKTQLEAQVTEHKAAAEITQATIMKLEGDNRNLGGEMAGLKGEQARLLGQIADLEEKRVNLTQKIGLQGEAMKSMLEQVDSEAKKEIARLKAVVEEREAQLVEAQRQTLTQSATQMEQVRKEATEQIATLKTRVSDLQTLLEAIKTQKLETAGQVAAGNVVFDEKLATMLAKLQEMLIKAQVEHAGQIGEVQKGLIAAQQQAILANTRRDLHAENEKLNLEMEINEKKKQLRELVLKIKLLHNDAEKYEGDA
jgi:DNA repair exonuclease SbcCD ATPase subunit